MFAAGISIFLEMSGNSEVSVCRTTISNTVLECFDGFHHDRDHCVSLFLCSTMTPVQVNNLESHSSLSDEN